MNFIVPELRDIRNAGWHRAWWIVIMILCLASCNSSKYLAGDEELLVSQRVTFSDKRQISNRGELNYQLSTLARQQPNSNFFFLWPREWFYFKNSQPADSSRFNRFLRGTIGQPPAIYSDSLSRLAARDMEDFLFRLGHFNGQVYHEADRGKRRTVNLIYHVKAGPRYLLDSVVFRSPNPTIDSLLQVSTPQSYLQSGDPLDLNAFDQEKTRISRLLRNEGFAFFSGSYIDDLEIDTSRRSGYADIFLTVVPPAREAPLRQYRTGSVTVYTDFNPLVTRGEIRRDTLLDGVRILSRRDRFRIRPEVLRENILLEPGAISSRDLLEKTNLQLNSLGLYRFVRINQQIDSLDDRLLHYQIQLSPSERMSIGADLDLNYTNRNGNNVGAGNLIGISLSPSFQNRNLFRGAELLVASLRAGVELDPSFRDDSPFLNTIDLGADISLYLPRFRDFGLYRFLGKIPAPWRGNLLTDRFYERLQRQASTRFSLGYENLLIRGFYGFTIFNARQGYDLRRSTTTNYRINHLAVDILEPTTAPSFDTILQTNQFITQSFGQQYFLSFLFRNLEYNRSGLPDSRGRSVSFTGRFEVAGAEVHALNGLVNALREDEAKWRPGTNAIFAKYTLADLNIRYYKQFTPQHSLATRLNVGAVRPYGGEEAVPYVKQFFVGGANSMRAWAPRGLGPGGFLDTLSLNTDNNLRLFQTGDFRLELNVEYRFPIASFFKGAFFADIGNVWTFANDRERPGAQLLLRARPNADNSFVHQPFYRQIAVGAGTGLRIDLSYFIFRLDASLPMRYNYPQNGQGFPLERDGSPIPESAYWRSFDTFRFRDITWQLGLGYPF